MDAVNENWPAAMCGTKKKGKKGKKMGMSVQCEGDATNDWTPPVADLDSGLSIGTPLTPLALWRSMYRACMSRGCVSPTHRCTALSYCPFSGRDHARSDHHARVSFYP